MKGRVLSYSQAAVLHNRSQQRSMLRGHPRLLLGIQLDLNEITYADGRLNPTWAMQPHVRDTPALHWHVLCLRGLRTLHHLHAYSGCLYCIPFPMV